MQTILQVQDKLKLESSFWNIEEVLIALLSQWISRMYRMQVFNI